MACLFQFKLKSGYVVPCGKCHDCRQRLMMDWTTRLYYHNKGARSAYFLTLTYSPESLPILSDGILERGGEIPFFDGSEKATLWKPDVQLFIMRLRKINKKYWSYPMKYFCTAEYGPSTLRPHYHLLIFNLLHQLKSHIQDIWNMGNVKVGTVTDKSIHYCASHQHKKWIFQDGTVPPFRLISKGIGLNYVEGNYGRHKLTTQGPPATKIIVNGNECPLPRYYRNKIFNPIEADYYTSEMRRQVDESFDPNETEQQRLDSYQDRRRKQIKKLLKHKL